MWCSVPSTTFRGRDHPDHNMLSSLHYNVEDHGGARSKLLDGDFPGIAVCYLRSMTEMPRTWGRWLWWALPSFLFFLWNAWNYRHFLLDDAYISLRYARNLVEGYGLVFNPEERVEGYTNFLWVMLGALFLHLGIDAMAAWKLVSALAMAGLFVMVRRLEGLDQEPSPRLSGFTVPAVFWLFLVEGFGYWTTTGMETTLYSSLFVTGLYLGLREAQDERRWGSVIVYILLAMTRPEGVLVFALGQVVILVAGYRHHGQWPWRRLMKDGLLFAAAYGIYFAWRFHYYGEVFPNTYHAKVTGGREQWWNGLINLGQWALDHPPLALACVTPLFFFARRESRRALSVEFGVLWFLCLAYGGYVVSVGGDFMPFFRFFLPIMPLCAVLLVWQLERLSRRSVFGYRVAVALLVVSQLGTGFLSEQRLRAFVAHRTTVVGQEVGRYFAETFEEDDLIAVNTAGSLPYESRLPTVDMLGLTDAAIARHPVYIISPLWAGHRRGWGEYVLEKRPRTIVWYNSAGLAEPHYLGDHQLAEDPFFRFFYTLRRVELPTPQQDGGAILGRFPRHPFGEESVSGAPELGVRFEARDHPFPWTAVYGHPIRLVYFEFRRDREEFWPLMESSGKDVDVLLNSVVRRWRQEKRTRQVDPEASRRAEALCDRALERIQAGDRAAARRLLGEAAAIPEAGVARVYQYVANLAILEGQVFLAIRAQQEALRLEPENELHRRNLRALLTQPYESLRTPKQSSSEQ